MRSKTCCAELTASSAANRSPADAHRKGGAERAAITRSKREALAIAAGSSRTLLRCTTSARPKAARATT
jgi:hypothetical protein